MKARDLVIGDVLHVLKYGFVYEPAQMSTQAGYYKYLMESTTPNSNRRKVRVVVIPAESPASKVVSAMWVDEPFVNG